MKLLLKLLVAVQVWLVLVTISYTIAAPYTMASAFAEISGNPPPSAIYDQLSDYLAGRWLGNTLMLVVPSVAGLVLSVVLLIKQSRTDSERIVS